MKPIVLFLSLCLLFSIPLIYSLTIYQPDNCQRLLATLRKQIESLKTFDVQLVESLNKQQEDLVSYDFATKSKETFYYLCNCQAKNDLLFLQGIRGFEMKQIVMSPKVNNLVLLVFKDGNGKEIGHVSIERVITAQDFLKTITNSNKQVVSIPSLSSSYDVVSGIGALDWNKHVVELIEKATKSNKQINLPQAAKDFITQLHIEEAKKPPIQVAKETVQVEENLFVSNIIKIRIEILNFVHEASGVLDNSSIAFSCAWDSTHGAIWSPNGAYRVKNTTQTLNTANVNVFPTIVVPQQNFTCGFLTANCSAPVDGFYLKNLSGACSKINVSNA